MEQGNSAPNQVQSSAPTQGNAQPQVGQQSSTGGSDIKSVTQAAEGKNTQTQAGQSESFDVKVNGKVVKMSRQEVLDYASMSHAANSKFDEASKLKKSVDKIISTAKSNPIQALMDPALGLTKDQIRDAFEKWYTSEYIEPDQLSPEQKRSKELEQKLKAYEEAEAEKLKQQKDAEEAELTNKQREYLQGQIIEALERSGLPKTPLIASRMAFYMRENLMKGWDAPIDLIVKQVKQERQSLMSGEVGTLQGQDLINYLGEDVVNKIRQHDLKQLREQRSAKTPEFTKSKSQSGDGYGNGDKISSSEVARRLKELRSGKRIP